MTVIEARYVGPFTLAPHASAGEVPEWGTWHEWQKYDAKFYAEKALPILRVMFSGLYEFRMVKM
jgi:hypothetical protein